MERRGRDLGGEAQSDAGHRESKYAKRPGSETSEARLKTFPETKTSLMSSKAETCLSLLKEQGLAARAEKTAMATTPKEMAAEKDLAMASGEATNHRDRSNASVGGKSHSSVAKTSVSRTSGSSRASRAARIEQLEREHALQLEILKATATAELANLKLSLEKKMSRIVDDFASSSSKSSKMLDKMKKTERDSVSSVSKTSEAKWPRRTESKEPSTPKRQPLLADEAAARKVWPAKLPTFSGSPKEWPIFYSCYTESTKACGFSSLENIMRLEAALTGAARDAVASKLMLPNAAPLVMEVLKRLYGRPALLIKELIEKVRATEAPKPERLDTLITFGLAVQQLCDHLTACEMQDHMANPMLLDELVEKLPATRRLEWARFKRHFERPTLREFGAFMDELMEDCCEVTVYAPAKVEAGRAPVKPLHRSHTFTHSSSTVEVSTPVAQPVVKQDERGSTGNLVAKCFVCNDPSHRVRECKEFQRMPLAARMEVVTQRNLCQNCLSLHWDKACRSKQSCRVTACGQRHHTLLHSDTGNVKAQCNTHRVAEPEILFRVVPVTLHKEGRSVDAFALLDEGSNLTMIESSLAEQLGVTGKREPMEMLWTSDVRRTEEASQRVSFEISARGEGRRYTVAAAHTVKQLSLPKQTLNDNVLISKYNHFQGLPVTTYLETVPQILIGLQDVALLEPLETRSGELGEPIAVRCPLGWAIYGPCAVQQPAVDQRTQSYSAAVSVNQPAEEEKAPSCGSIPEWEAEVRFIRAYVNCHTRVTDSMDPEADRELHEALRQYFTLEGVGVSSFAENLPEPKDIARAKELLASTTVKEDGRFTTGLLWRDDDVCLPDSYQMAEKRLVSLERKLERNPELKKEVHDQINTYLEQGFAHKATQEELATADPNRVWYLPINVVGHPRKPEKKRLVWDAAAKVDGVSLNSQLLKGPDLLLQLPAVFGN
ncbi:uncharacterized protein LOC131291496 [Anopheles ziemanni]|uniref:uncharacterized protein LOC131269836 n=1 Tax=Anopheles coustani TaxID=139045 RepID=UPI0026586BE8|nr:uncharacterized protein LOC131269836 [Anopheles coustani]XP_058176697.1 uncharacterized protein LOC131291496 [Anopheles ziemanni]